MLWLPTQKPTTRQLQLLRGSWRRHPRAADWWWLMHEGDGTTVADLGYAAQHGTMIDFDPATEGWQTTAQHGPRLYFANASPFDYVTMGIFAGLVSTEDLSLHCRFTTTNMGSMALVSKRVSTVTGNVGYILAMDFGFGDGILFAECSDGTTELQIQATGTTYHDGALHIVITSFDRVTPSQSALWVDGINVTTSVVGSVTGTLSNPGVECRIGAVHDAGTPFNWLDGSIDDVRVWRRAVREAEILSITQQPYLEFAWAWQRQISALPLTGVAVPPTLSGPMFTDKLDMRRRHMRNQTRRPSQRGG